MSDFDHLHSFDVAAKESYMLYQTLLLGEGDRLITWTPKLRRRQRLRLVHRSRQYTLQALEAGITDQTAAQSYVLEKLRADAEISPFLLLILAHALGALVGEIVKWLWERWGPKN